MGASPHVTMDNIEISQQGVLNLLLNHEPHKSPGLDGIGALFLKNTEITPMLTHLFQKWCSSHSLEACTRITNLQEGQQG